MGAREHARFEANVASDMADVMETLSDEVNCEVAPVCREAAESAACSAASAALEEVRSATELEMERLASMRKRVERRLEKVCGAALIELDVERRSRTERDQAMHEL